MCSQCTCRYVTNYHMFDLTRHVFRRRMSSSSADYPSINNRANASVDLVTITRANAVHTIPTHVSIQCTLTKNEDRHKEYTAPDGAMTWQWLISSFFGRLRSVFKHGSAYSDTVVTFLTVLFTKTKTMYTAYETFADQTKVPYLGKLMNSYIDLIHIPQDKRSCRFPPRPTLSACCGRNECTRATSPWFRGTKAKRIIMKTLIKYDLEHSKTRAWWTSFWPTMQTAWAQY